MNAGERLQTLMDLRGVRTAAELGRMTGVKAVTVRQQIARGSIPKDTARAYARALNVSVDWLLFGQGAGPAQHDAPRHAPRASEPAPAPPPPPLPLQRSLMDEMKKIAEEVESLERRIAAIKAQLGLRAA